MFNSEFTKTAFILHTRWSEVVLDFLIGLTCDI